MLKQLMNGGSLKSLMLRSAENDDGSDLEYDLDAIRENFEADRGRKVKVSDAILATAIQNNSQWDEWMADENEKAIFDFIEKVEEAANRVAITDPGITALVEKIDDAFNEEILACSDAIAKNKSSAVDIYAQLRRVYTLDELAAMPFVGTTPDDVKGTNYRADKITTKDRVSGVEITTTWINDFVSAMPRVKPWERELDLVKSELGKSGTVPKFKNTGKGELESLKSALSGRINGVRSMFKRAINAHHQFEAIQMMPDVVLEWIPGDAKTGIKVPKQFGTQKFDGKSDFYITSSGKCLWMHPKGQSSKGKTYSVTQLNNFDVQAAIANGGQVADLLATLEREPEQQKKGDGSEMLREEALSTIQKTANYLDVKDNMADTLLILADKKNDERKDLLNNLNRIAHLINPILRKYRDDVEKMGEVVDTKPLAATG